MKDQRLLIPELESIKKKLKELKDINMVLTADMLQMHRVVEPLYTFYKKHANKTQMSNPNLPYVIKFVLKRVNRCINSNRKIGDCIEQAIISRIKAGDEPYSVLDDFGIKYNKQIEGK